MKIIIGSRGSKLALKQSEIVAAALQDAVADVQVIIQTFSTKGDQILDKPLHQIGSKGLFTQEIEEALRVGTIDLAVHSMKDMPGTIADGLTFAGTLSAADPHDCLVFSHPYRCLDDLPIGAVVATGSARRRMQLLALRPDLKIVGIRGNVETRIKKMQEEGLAAIVLAMAGLQRLGLDAAYSIQPLSFQEMVPACAQGILALEVRQNATIIPVLEKIIDPVATARMQLERLFLTETGGGCHSPVGAHVSFVAGGIYLDAVFGDENGQKITTWHGQIADHFEQEIKQIARQMKAEVLSHG